MLGTAWEPPFVAPFPCQVRFWLNSMHLRHLEINCCVNVTTGIIHQSLHSLWTKGTRRREAPGTRCRPPHFMLNPRHLLASRGTASVSLFLLHYQSQCCMFLDFKRTCKLCNRVCSRHFGNIQWLIQVGKSMISMFWKGANIRHGLSFSCRWRYEVGKHRTALIANSSPWWWSEVPHVPSVVSSGLRNVL